MWSWSKKRTFSSKKKAPRSHTQPHGRWCFWSLQSHGWRSFSQTISRDSPVTSPRNQLGSKGFSKTWIDGNWILREEGSKTIMGIIVAKPSQDPCNAEQCKAMIGHECRLPSAVSLCQLLSPWLVEGLQKGRRKSSKMKTGTGRIVQTRLARHLFDVYIYSHFCCKFAQKYFSIKHTTCNISIEVFSISVTHFPPVVVAPVAGGRAFGRGLRPLNHATPKIDQLSRLKISNWSTLNPNSLTRVAKHPILDLSQKHGINLDY